MEPWAPENVWLVVVSFVVAFVLACGIGANDVANSFGTSVGSKVLSVKTACWLATVFELAGAMLIGYKVSDTMRKGILQVSLYEGAEEEFMIGLLSSLAGSGIWLILATFFKLPISGTHSIVGATVGFSLVCRGTRGLSWSTLATIVASWFISPVMSGVVSVTLFLLIRRFILRSPSPLVPGLRSLPLFYGVTIAINAFSICHDGPELLYMDNIPTWVAVVISLVLGITSALVVQLVLVPWQRSKILEMMGTATKADVQFAFGYETDSSREGSPRPVLRENTPLPVISENVKEPTQLYTFPREPLGATNNGYSLAETQLHQDQVNGGGATKVPTDPVLLNIPTNGTNTPAYGLSPNSSAVPLIKERTLEPLTLEPNTVGSGTFDDPPEVTRIFSFLQILTATFGSFAHGGNDVSNAIGPLVAVWLVFTEGSVQQKAPTPLYILLYGGVGISVGLWLWGRRVIETIGEDLTKITASTGFTIEIGSAMTVLLASKIGLPISTTHCKVGSVVFVGWANASAGGVDWTLFRNIISAWVVTVPIAAGLSALFTAILRAIVL
ncbi:sodium-dependent phosphate transporter 2 isoform X2 [Macrosteles quadrilineatus]|uniref:sodium-dependent phosphate transporter 2 isoform X2 n=1 Tax=Macrosteles quadrilineatus TaxID=74068 RepID=UPI0023E1B8CC|nr:sodium-dependent phosphate transporter 2 isoform X2 [Macrosteles quadrilineatus]